MCTNLIHYSQFSWTFAPLKCKIAQLWSRICPIFKISVKIGAQDCNLGLKIGGGGGVDPFCPTKGRGQKCHTHTY
jgi:hypothetical protein